MLFVSHVAGFCYCEIDIEDQPAMPSANLIYKIYIHSGVGMLPTLTLYLSDPSQTLQNEMNLVEGIKCTIKLVRDGVEDVRVPRDFSLWSIVREVMSDGPMIRAVFIGRNPRWTTEAQCEAIEGPSSDVMGTLASRSGMEYEGPSSGTNDIMTWVNVQTTRSDFSEDVALHGWASDSSCMARVLTNTMKLKYKDLFDVMNEQAVATFAQNTEGAGAIQPVHLVRETKEYGVSGIINQWQNYGSKLIQHTMDRKDFPTVDGINVPVFGSALPINSNVRSEFDNPARVDYIGYDPGTAPKPGYNIHENYDRAQYQNTRLTGLFSERLRVLVQDFTDVEEFQSVEYSQKEGYDDTDSKALNGKYIVLGKVIMIKGGINYSETFDLGRPYVYLGGGGSEGGGSSPQPQPANSSNSELVQDSIRDREARQASAAQPTPVAKAQQKPTADQLDAMLTDLSAFNAASPSVPDTPMKAAGSMQPSDAQFRAAKNLHETITVAEASNGPLADAMRVSPEGFVPERSYVVQKVGVADVERSANLHADMVARNEAAGRSGLNGIDASTLSALDVELESTFMQRVITNTGTDTLDALRAEQFDTVVGATTGNTMRNGDWVSDTLRGGVIAQEFDAVIPSGNLITEAEMAAKRGTNFLMRADSLGLDAKSGRINPSAVIRFAEEFVHEAKDPQRYLERKGAEAFRDAFGIRMPRDAEDVVQSIASKLPSLRHAFSTNEIIAGRPGTAISGSVNIDLRDAVTTRNAAKAVTFRFGGRGLNPIVERVVNKRRINVDAHTVADVLSTNRDSVAWSTFARMGSAVRNDKKWSYPDDPVSVLRAVGSALSLA